MPCRLKRKLLELYKTIREKSSQDSSYCRYASSLLFITLTKVFRAAAGIAFLAGIQHWSPLCKTFGNKLDNGVQFFVLLH